MSFIDAPLTLNDIEIKDNFWEFWKSSGLIVLDLNLKEVTFDNITFSGNVCSESCNAGAMVISTDQFSDKDMI